MIPRKIVVPIGRAVVTRIVEHVTPPLSHAGTASVCKNVENQIEHDKQHTDEQHIHLNDGIVPIENRLDAERSEPRPRKDILDDNRPRD